MTGDKPQKDPSQSESEAPGTDTPGESESESHGEPQTKPVESDPEESKPTEPAGREYGSVRALSEAEITAIESLYDGSIRNYTANGSLNENGRPQPCVDTANRLYDLFEYVHVFYSTDKECALTFILESTDEDQANAILDALAAKNVKATFFASQIYEAAHPDIIRRLLLEKHVLGSLGATNPSDGLAVYGLIDQHRDILNFYNYVYDKYDYKMTSFFYNHDVYSDRACALVTQMGNDLYFYTVSYHDNTTSEIDRSSFLWSMKSLIHSGAIYSFHAVNPAVAEILPELIDYITASGYTIKCIGK